MKEQEEMETMAFEDDEDEEMIDEGATSSETTKTAAEPIAGPRKRGRKKGVKVGPRPTVWSCSGIVDGKCIQERFQAADGSTFDQLESFSSEDASDAFFEAYGIEPEHTDGPFHAKKGGQYNAAKKRETVSITLPNLTMKRESAVYKGWKGMAYAIEGRDDVAYFMFGEEINPSPDKKKNPPTAKTVFRAALEFAGDRS